MKQVSPFRNLPPRHRLQRALARGISSYYDRYIASPNPPLRVGDSPMPLHKFLTIWLHNYADIEAVNAMIKRRSAK